MVQLKLFVVFSMSRDVALQPPYILAKKRIRAKETTDKHLYLSVFICGSV